MRFRCYAKEPSVSTALFGESDLVGKPFVSRARHTIAYSNLNGQEQIQETRVPHPVLQWISSGFFGHFMNLYTKCQTLIFLHDVSMVRSPALAMIARRCQTMLLPEWVTWDLEVDDGVE